MKSPHDFSQTSLCAAGAHCSAGATTLRTRHLLQRKIILCLYFAFPPQINTNVYVTGIPEDASVAEVVEVFGKCGLIKVW